MDNDGKMNPKPADEATGTDLVEQTKAYFLQVAMDEFRTAQERYNLNDEFAKTKRNRNFVVLLVVSATIIGFGLFAFLFNNHVETQSNKVSISTQEFDDINLRDLLDKAKVLESDLALRQAELKNLSDNTAVAIDKAKSDSGDQLTMFRSTNPKAADLQVKKEELDRKLNTRIQAIQQAAAEAEKPIQAAITQLKAELATFDSRKLEVAKKQEVVLNNERRVYDIERERMQTLLENQIAKLSADYDAQIKRRDAFIKDLETSAHDTLVREQERLKLLYNPVLVDDLSLRLLVQPIDNQRLARYSLNIPAAYQRAGLPGAERITAANQALTDYNALMKIINQVPWTNSVPAVMAQLQYRTILAVDAATGMFDDFWKTIKDREATIAERDNTIKERDRTIADREATIAERNAALQEAKATMADQDVIIKTRENDIKERDAQLVKLQQTMDAAVEQEKSRFAGLLESFDNHAKAAGVDGVVVDPKDSASLVAYLRSTVTATLGARFYLMRNASEVVDEYELTAAGPLARLSPVPVAARTKPIARQGSQAPAPVKFAGKAAMAMDWVIQVDNYAAWKTAYSKAPIR